MTDESSKQYEKNKLSLKLDASGANVRDLVRLKVVGVERLACFVFFLMVVAMPLSGTRIWGRDLDQRCR